MFAPALSKELPLELAYASLCFFLFFAAAAAAAAAEKKKHTKKNTKTNRQRKKKNQINNPVDLLFYFTSLPLVSLPIENKTSIRRTRYPSFVQIRHVGLYCCNVSDRKRVKSRPPQV